MFWLVTCVLCVTAAYRQHAGTIDISWNQANGQADSTATSLHSELLPISSPMYVLLHIVPCTRPFLTSSISVVKTVELDNSLKGHICTLETNFSVAGSQGVVILSAYTHLRERTGNYYDQWPAGLRTCIWPRAHKEQRSGLLCRSA